MELMVLHKRVIGLDVHGSAQGFVRKWAIGVWNMSQNLHGKVSAQILFPTAICVQKNRQYSAGERTVKASAGKHMFSDTILQL